MDFRSQLSSFPSGADREYFIAAVGKSEEIFGSLVKLALYEKDPLAWRAAWILDGSDEKNPGLATGFIAGIVSALEEIKSKGALRSLLRLLCRHDVPEEEQGRLIDLCFRYLVSELYPVAVKVHAMQIIYQHVLIYPELKQELITVISDQVENNTVGFKSRGMRIIKLLKGKN